MDGDLAYTIVTAATDTDLSPDGINPANVGVTDADDDTARFTVSPPSGLVTTKRVAYFEAQR